MDNRETYEFAAKTHAENPDHRTNGIPYGTHLARVAARARRLGDDAIRAALLHDIIEDTPVRHHDLEAIGQSDRTISMVRLASRNEFPDLTFEEWTDFIARSGDMDGIRVKISDVSDNLSPERMLPLNPPPRRMRGEGLSAVIFKMVDGRSTIGGEAGFHKRYYEVQNAFCSAVPDPEDFCRPFGTIDDYKFVKSIMTESDFVFIPRLTGGLYGDFPVEVISDKNGNPYLSALVPDEISRMYSDASLVLDGAEDFIGNKVSRDGDRSHITILNSAEYGRTLKFRGAIEHPETMRFAMFGVGRAEDDKNTSLFAVCSSGAADGFRKSLGYSHRDLHMTIGFSSKDVHKAGKGIDTIILPFGGMTGSIPVQTVLSQRRLGF